MSESEKTAAAVELLERFHTRLLVIADELKAAIDDLRGPPVDQPSINKRLLDAIRELSANAQARRLAPGEPQ